ncbi:MAG: PhzF family phenazine biosynthesis protein [Acetobacteraceae bacterium]|nr:PhzF family phenazine biosynthesis protein [Acetobacteraceae bacterium]MBV8520928.1 PhzF family phenazine biosynthesis protein [Acetobacteraceae bacterium]MBV8592627.1 PhzF family phenazine biosynthesis protein [Acetobacteraceae bacterium]
MASWDFVTLDVFTDRPFGGNPLAVFPAGEGLTDADMRALAREFGYSETSFVFPPTDPVNTARARIFTPRGEVPFAGHPTIGTAFVLAQLGRDLADTVALEEEAGLVSVHVQRNAQGKPTGGLVAAPRSLSVGIEVPIEEVAECIRLQEADIRTVAHPPLVASVGLDFVICELTSLNALARATPNSAAFRETADRYPEIAGHFALHLYVRDPSDPGSIRSRTFSPLLGVPEDPATGSASAALAGLLVSLAPGEDVELGFEIAQGEEIGRPSRILASASKSAEGAIRASLAGDCVPVMRGQVDL